MELKDFDRITLASGETRKVSFNLTPYQISLLNDQMDRVVETGEFKILVGGKSPSYKAGDRIKDSVGYLSDNEGLSETINYTKTFNADFELFYIGMEENFVYDKKHATVKIRNVGNIMDTGKVSMFVNGVRSEDVHHYELAPGEEKIIRFNLDKEKEIKNITFQTKYKSITI
jgi:beta-glucosidase